MLTDRLNEILELARHTGRVTVDDLAERFQVTPQTIRKDLGELCQKRLLARVHGGAIVSSGVENVQYEARRLIATDQKTAIGLAAASLIPNNASLFINIGTTTEAVARALLQHKEL
ncbi:MAG: DeoR/GlpR family DNA-binding transcription regulator, partial [Dongiaceae bacterium]